MKEQIVTFQTAVVAKDAGFYIPTNCYYNVVEPDRIVTVGAFNHNYESHGFVTVSAPTQALLQKFYREEHEIHITITSESQESWQWHIQLPGETLDKFWKEDFATYEEALEDALIIAGTVSF